MVVKCLFDPPIVLKSSTKLVGISKNSAVLVGNKPRPSKLTGREGVAKYEIRRGSGELRERER